MTPTGIIAVVLGIVIVMLLVAISIIWFRGNKNRQSFTKDRADFEGNVRELQSQLNELERNLASAKGSGGECAELTKQQGEIINKLQSKISELEQEHDTTITHYKDELKRAEESNRAAQSRIVSLQREKQSLSEARNEIDDLKKRLAEAKEPTTTEKEVIDEINSAVIHGWDLSIAKYIRENYETVIKAISNEELIPKLNKGPNWSNIIGNIKHNINMAITDTLKKLE